MTYQIVANAAAQHSVWPEAKALPEGWAPVGFSGTLTQCLGRIAAVWTDLRPGPSAGALSQGTESAR